MLMQTRTLDIVKPHIKPDRRALDEVVFDLSGLTAREWDL